MVQVKLLLLILIITCRRSVRTEVSYRRCLRSVQQLSGTLACQRSVPYRRTVFLCGLIGTGGYNAPKFFTRFRHLRSGIMRGQDQAWRNMLLRPVGRTLNDICISLNSYSIGR